MTRAQTTTDRIYETVLARGEAGRDAFRDALRRRGIAPTPKDEPGHLYAPNPVVVPRSLIRGMTADIESFCEARRASIDSAQDLVSTLPANLRDTFSSPDAAARIVDDLFRAHPFVCLDAYLVDGDAGLRAAYLEWQTFPAYPSVALETLDATRETFPEILAAGGRFDPEGETLESLRARVRATLLLGVEDDARTAVLLDLDPWEQETRREFRFARDLTGGERRGMGVIDPREVRYVDGRACYRRDGGDVPIAAAISRLVHDDMERLLERATAEERATMKRFFGDASISWGVHPLHFLYGTKGDFPGFHEAGLSEALVPCRFVDAAMIAEAEGGGRLEGWVQKPVEGCGGREIIAGPEVAELREGSLLQRLIEPAACHRTLAGPQVPEIRVMALPDGRGGLYCSSVFTRVKAPHEFRSNAGVTARADAPGTGEGYAVIAFDE